MKVPRGERQRMQRIVERFPALGRTAPATAGQPPEQEESDLRTRVAELEAAVEALQDQLYRESRRHDAELTELRHQLRPAELARALSDDTRRRGL